ncbi:radical SAM protein [Streptomyces iranensis]|uniref:radical SAM protein n=1 Tax=Streptomyces iranensis TaxID=576784 RepID=UPI0039B78D5C
MGMNDERLRKHISGSLEKCYVVPVAVRCNARCVFCATLEYRPNASTELMDEQGVEQRVAMLVEAGATRFEVTGGGEPTLHPRLSSILHTIRSAGGQYIKLYTNASRLPPRLDIDQLNVSRAHFDPDKNQAIMHLAGGSKSLEELIARARRGGYGFIRLSVPLIRGGIDSLTAAAAFLERLTGLVEGVVFRPLYPATPDRESQLPRGSSAQWQEGIERLAGDFRDELAVEYDGLGCHRALQTILASDLQVYGNWSLTERIQP